MTIEPLLTLNRALGNPLRGNPTTPQSTQQVDGLLTIARLTAVARE